MPSAPSITPFSYDARAGAAPTAIGFPFQFQVHEHLFIDFAPQDAVAS